MHVRPPANGEARPCQRGGGSVHVERRPLGADASAARSASAPPLLGQRLVRKHASKGDLEARRPGAGGGTYCAAPLVGRRRTALTQRERAARSDVATHWHSHTKACTYEQPSSPYVMYNRY
eukprot:4803011-Pyramimonas_sp.AAC.1